MDRLIVIDGKLVNTYWYLYQQLGTVVPVGQTLNQFIAFGRYWPTYTAYCSFVEQLSE